ncbi:hypothetical protein SDC9_80176 [bioreactor metagenome]|uniref:Uncharacterized protein n=1 Tax=bioreactor metagenome TaxID=1076179 RepID=A0A644YZ73_9ZZZZ
MESRKTRGLNQDEASIFVMLEFNSDVDELYTQMQEEDGGWVLKAIEKRFKVLEINVDKRVMIAVLSIGDGVIGHCVKYVDDIALWSNEHKHSEITWDRFTQEIYPHGIPIL